MDMTEILRVLIEDTGLSTKKFAENVGLPPTTIYGMFKNGCEKSSINTIISICEYLNVNIEDIRKLSLKENVTKEDILHLKDFQKMIDNDSFISKLKERPDLFKLIHILEPMNLSDIQSLTDALDNASTDDIALIFSIIDRISHNGNASNKKTTSK